MAIICFQILYSTVLSPCIDQPLISMRLNDAFISARNNLFCLRRGCATLVNKCTSRVISDYSGSGGCGGGGVGLAPAALARTPRSVKRAHDRRAGALRHADRGQGVQTPLPRPPITTQLNTDPTPPRTTTRTTQLISSVISSTITGMSALCRHQSDTTRQEAQLSPRDRAMGRVS